MSPLAIVLVLSSGFLHAVWNSWAKESEEKLEFILSMQGFIVVLLAPAVIYLGLNGARLGFRAPLFWYLTFISGVVHFFYSYFLANAYRYGDISVAYPVSRGFSPFLVALFSYLLLGETPSALGATGISLIAIGLIVMSKDKGEDGENRETGFGGIKKTIQFALLTGVAIAAYTLVDGRAVRSFNPISFSLGFFFVSSLLLSLAILNKERKGDKKNPFANISDGFPHFLWAGGISSLSYLLALYAMRLSQLAYIASFRNVSILFALLLGGVRLKEAVSASRILGALTLFAGVFLISMG